MTNDKTQVLSKNLELTTLGALSKTSESYVSLTFNPVNLALFQIYCHIGIKELPNQEAKLGIMSNLLDIWLRNTPVLIKPKWMDRQKMFWK